MKRLCMAWVVGFVLAGCNTGSQEQEQQQHRARLEAAKNSQLELEARTKALSEDIEWMRKRVRELEGSQQTERRNLETLQWTLTESWRGDPAVLKERMAATDVPQALQASLLKAQEEWGDAAPERVFIEAVQKEDLASMAEALGTWEVNKGVTALPAEQAPSEEENTCTRAEVTFSCTPLPLAGPKDDLTQLCRMSMGDSVWVLRVDQGSLVRVNLLGSRHDSYRPVRMFSPEVWVLAGEDDSPTSPGKSNVSSKAWLEVFKVSGSSAHDRQGIRRHALPLERQGQRLAQAELDLDGDGIAELLVLDGKEVQAVHYELRHDDAVLWSEADVCPLIARRTEKELEPARAPCAAWAQAKQPKDGGTP
jgi:hypothetical protein